MKRFLIRNDDVAADTDIAELKRFCDICDKYGYKIIQAITPRGECRKARVFMTNEEIRASSDKLFEDNMEVIEFLQSRRDHIGVHGLWHTHAPTEEEVAEGKSILEGLGFKPAYFVPPFNEGEYPEEVAGLKLCQLSLKKGERLEDFLKKGEPKAPIMYLHSWRFNDVNYTFEQLEKCLQRLEK